MKKTTLFALLLTVLIAASFAAAIPISAAERVVFVSDEGAGKRDGSSAENAMGVVIADRGSDNHKNSLLYQVTDLLRNTGGRVVVCGPVRIDVHCAKGSSSHTKDCFLASNGDYRITFTSVYGGVDYRKTNNAAITVDGIAHIVAKGETTWENITFIMEGENRYLCGGYERTIIGSGVTSRPADPENEGDAAYYLSVAAGNRYRTAERNSELIFRKGAGEFGTVSGANVGIGINYPHVGNTLLTIEGGTFYGDVIGTSAERNTPTTGSTTITISGGRFLGGIYGCGNGGYLNTNASVNMTILDGDFTDCIEITQVFDGYENHLPSRSTLNITRCKIDLCEIIYPKILEFTEIKMPLAFVPPVIEEEPIEDGILPDEAQIPSASTEMVKPRDEQLLLMMGVLSFFVVVSLVMIGVGVVQKIRMPKA